MLRFSMALLVAAALAAAETSPVSELLGQFTRDLSEGDTTAVMSNFHPAMPGYGRLHRDVSALSGRDVSCSIVILKDEGDQRRRTLELDWILEVAGSRRRATVHAVIEARGQRWIVTAFEPPDLFTPPQ